MKVIAISEFGGTEKFFEVERETPRPRADEVLIRIRAGSFNPIDYKIRQGRYGGDLPMVLGHDAAGVVEEVGNSVGRLNQHFIRTRPRCVPLYFKKILGSAELADRNNFHALCLYRSTKS